MQEIAEVQIRRMKTEDLEQVCQIENQIFSMPWTREGFLTSLKNENNIYLVVEQMGKITGYCGMWGVAGEGQITNVAVKSGFQGRGIGSHLLARLLELGNEQLLSSFTLEVRVSNHRAIHLYERAGFRQAGIRRNFYDNPREDAVIMWK